MNESSAVYHVPHIDHPLHAVVRVPGSKSIANRALICATLAHGVSTLQNVPGGDDTAAMLECVALLGAGVGADLRDDTIMRIHGTGGVLREGPMTLPARLAGTTSRFVTALCALGRGHYEIDGLPPLRARPMGPLHEALATLGCDVRPGDGWGHLPVTITGLATADPDRGSATSTSSASSSATAPTMRTVALPGDISSQYVTALMLIAPYLEGGLIIQLTTTLVSRPYVDITASVMSSFGAPAVVVTDTTIEIGPGHYRACDYLIEPDASSASYPLAAAAICGGRVRVPDLRGDALQGDAGFADVLAAMGCSVARDADGTTVERHGELVGININMANLSDLVPTLAVVAPFATSPTTIEGVGFIRAKESDRLGDLANELRSCGIVVSERDDGLRIAPGYTGGASMLTHHDHRLAMAFGILGLRIPGVRVHDPDVVSKSWPDFWMALEAMRGGQ